MINNTSAVKSTATPPSMGSQAIWFGSVVAVCIIALGWGGDFLRNLFLALSFGVFDSNQEGGSGIMPIFGYLCFVFYAVGFLMVIQSFKRSMRIQVDSFDRLLFLLSLAFVLSAARLLNTYL